MTKLDMRTPDFTNENIAQIAALFPNCLTEAKDEKGNIKKAIDFDLLKQELSANIVDGTKERYTLNWPGKKEALVKANEPINKTLRPCEEESVNFDTTQNLYIEGDNLEALKLLQESYLGKIKMIYIDPPYNTGNDFIYEDDYSINQDDYDLLNAQKNEEGGRLVANPESNGRYHSDWLSMIYPRLKLARNLLKKDGAIFISIDENEIFNLRNICNEVFGEDNFLTELAIKVRHENRILKADKDFHETYEYCLVYRRSIEYKQVKKIEDNTSIDKYVYSIEITGLPVEQILCDGKKVDVYAPDNYKVIKHDLANENFYQSISIRGSLKEGNSSGRFFMKHLDKIKDKYGYLYKVPDMGNDKYDYRYFMKQPTENHANGIYFQGVPLDKKDTKEVPYPNFYDFVNEFNNVGYEGEVEYRSGKKPLSFINQLFKLSGVLDDDNAIILDFFSGSASTAEAVIRANINTDSNKKFIMVQLPENLDETLNNSIGTTKSIIEKTIDFLNSIDKPHILTELGKERIRRAGRKILEENKNKEGIENLDIGFRVLKVDSSNMKDVYYNPDEINQLNLFDTVDNIKEGRSAEDLLFQVLLDWGVDLMLPIRKEEVVGHKVFFVDNDALAACFENDLNEEFITALAKKEILRVVFKDSGFANDDIRINVEQIFKQYSPDTEVKVI